MKFRLIAPLVGVGLLALSPATTSKAVQYNPKELTVDKQVPWQKSKGRPSGNTISSANASASASPTATPALKNSSATPKKSKINPLHRYYGDADGDARSASPTATPVFKKAASPSDASLVGATKWKNIVLKRGFSAPSKPILSAQPNKPGSSSSTGKATFKEFTITKKTDTAPATPTPAPKRSTSTPRKSKNMTLKGKKILQN